jgi:uncharacterized protein (TIGR04141 family)
VAAKKPSKLRFNCYLIRSDIGDWERALRPKYREGGVNALQRITPSPSAPIGAVALLGQPSEKIPRWAQDLNSQFPGLSAVTNTSNRMVIFLPVRNRVFAVCFGYGSTVLEWESIESNFGLRVAARNFQADDLTELRSRRIDASARTQSVQIPVGGELRDLGVNLEGEFVRKLAGHIESSTLALDGSVLAGDSISFKSTTNLSSVQDALTNMLTSVQESASRDGFQFVDSLEPLRSGEETAKLLDERLAREIFGQGDIDDDLSTQILEYAPPDEIRMEDVDQVVLENGSKRAVLHGFSMSELRNVLRELGVRATAPMLRSVRVVPLDANGDPVGQQTPLRNWLVFEVGNQAQRYILTLGRWFRLQESYSDRLDSDLGRIEDVTATLSLPDTTAPEVEKEYNARAASALAGTLLLMDAVMIKTEDGDRVEACDLLHNGGYLIHVKRYNGSQTLSHLFSQGSVSAQLLRGDTTMRAHFLSEVSARDAKFTSAAAVAPQIVTYAIAIKDSMKLPTGLPTFSKVNLRDFAKRLRQTGATPTLARIRVVPT